jgi:17beta-estradiol 17-dehydrogenase / very-long-chain 3-oxoacyl-CoA reductase
MIKLTIISSNLGKLFIYSKMTFEQILQILGLFVTFYFSFKFLCFAWLYGRPSSIHRYLKDTQDSNGNNWALVTGASDGIGQAFAGELCRRGFNVVLHGRNPGKLERVGSEIKQKYPDCLIRIVISDANLSHPSSLEQDILAKVQDIRLSVLINNVGGTAGVQSPTEVFSTIENHTVEAVDGIININARFTSQITRLLLPLLLKRPRSLILSLSSAAEAGMPYLSVYSGTKSYVTAFSKALTAEMQAERRNVEVLGVVVGSVQTDSNNHRLSLFHPRAEPFVTAVLDRVGCGEASVWAYLPHALQAVALGFFPDWTKRMLLISVMRGRKDVVDRMAKKS